jgi:hypothetical protein
MSIDFMSLDEIHHINQSHSIVATIVTEGALVFSTADIEKYDFD